MGMPPGIEWPRVEDWEKLMGAVHVADRFTVFDLQGLLWGTGVIWVGFGTDFMKGTWVKAPIEWWTPGFEMPYKNDNERIEYNDY